MWVHLRNGVVHVAIPYRYTVRRYRQSVSLTNESQDTVSYNYRTVRNTLHLIIPFTPTILCAKISPISCLILIMQLVADCLMGRVFQTRIQVGVKQTLKRANSSYRLRNDNIQYTRSTLSSQATIPYTHIYVWYVQIKRYLEQAKKKNQQTKQINSDKSNYKLKRKILHRFERKI